jgi:tRNA G37 N-methylase Trm5
MQYPVTPSEAQIRCLIVQQKEAIKTQLQQLKALKIEHPIYRPATLTLEGTELHALPLREDLTDEQLQRLTDVRCVAKNSFKTKKATQQGDKNGLAAWLRHVTAELGKSARWSDEELNSLPKLLHWRLLGDILLFTLMSRDIDREQHDETQLQRLHDIAQAFLIYFGHDKLRSIVVESRGRGIGGELRTPDPKHVRLLWSHVTDDEPATTTVHVENGVLYKLDVRHVMYSMGNSAERIRFAHLTSRVNESPELAIDMFAGIGYFTLPLAKYGKLHKLIAIEKNPNSYNYLCANVQLNHVAEIVSPVLGDNRLVCNEYEARAQRILMGYLPETAPFLDRAVFFADPRGAIVHFHHLAGTEQLPDSDAIGNSAQTSAEECDTKFGIGFSQVFAAVRQWNDRRGTGTCHLLEFVRVKNYAPLIMHCVADVKITWQ